MDIAAHTMIGHHLQHPLGPGAILYPGKGSAWQPVVTSLPSLVDIPKESIIANTDFTTTSVIAKRRLSSKKRKKVASQQQSGEAGSSSSDQRSSCSPMGSANGSPAVTSTTYTPPAFDKSHTSHDDVLPRSTGVNASSQNVMTSSHGGITSSISTHVPHHIGHHPAVTASTGVQFHHPASGQFISVAPSSVSGAYHHPTVATAQTQFANPMLTQLQQELNYRFLQDRSSGVLIAHPNQVDQSQQQQHQQVHHGFRQHQPIRRDGSQPMDTSSSFSSSTSCVMGGAGGVAVSRRPGFKWCYAHITIAKQIQQQQQLRANELTSSSTASSVIALNQSHMTQADSTPNVVAAVPSVAVSVAAAAAHHHQQQQQQAQQQQQQLAILQMYGIPAANAVPAAAVPGGYMAVPYSSVQEVQLRMHQMAAAANVAGGASLHPGVSLVKPVGMDTITHGTTAADSLLGLNPAVAGGATAIQMLNGLHLQAAPYAAGHTVPLAAVAATGPSDLNNAAVFHGAASGQWMAPVPVVGSCIVNPLQPGIMATPWVK